MKCLGIYELKEMIESIHPTVVQDKFVGKINILDGSVDVTDPCYDSDTWCASFDRKVKAGVYDCYIDITNFPSIGVLEELDEDVMKGCKKVGDTEILNDHRISSLTIMYEGFKPNHFMWREVDADIGVDAGLCGFYNHKKDYDDEEWSYFCDNLTNLEEYEFLTCFLQDNGITVSSGFGDGSYKLYEAYNANEVIGLRLDFITEEDTEVYYE